MFLRIISSMATYQLVAIAHFHWLISIYEEEYKYVLLISSVVIITEEMFSLFLLSLIVFLDKNTNPIAAERNISEDLYRIGKHLIFSSVVIIKKCLCIIPNECINCVV